MGTSFFDQGFASGGRGGVADSLAGVERETAPPGEGEGRAAVRIAPPRAAPRRPPPAARRGSRARGNGRLGVRSRRSSCLAALLPLALLLQRGHQGLSMRPRRPINAATKAYQCGHEGLSTRPQRPIPEKPEEARSRARGRRQLLLPPVSGWPSSSPASRGPRPAAQLPRPWPGTLGLRAR